MVNNLGVKEVRVTLITGELSEIDANVSVAFDNSLIIRQIKVIEKADHYIIKYPGYKSSRDGIPKHKNYVYPSTKEAQDELNRIIYDAFCEARDEKGDMIHVKR